MSFVGVRVSSFSDFEDWAESNLRNVGLDRESTMIMGSEKLMDVNEGLPRADILHPTVPLARYTVGMRHLT